MGLVYGPSGVSWGVSRAREHRTRCAGLGGALCKGKLRLVVFDLVASGYHSVTGSRDDISHCNIVLPFACVTCQCLLYIFQSVITFTHF